MLSKGSDVLSVRDFARGDFESVFERAAAFEARARETLAGRVVASLFYEPSTRTRLSSEAAAQRLGARVIGFSGTEGTSVQKGESLRDTISMADRYADAIFLRHPFDGAARFAAEVAKTPVINCGDGSNQHPTQTFLDLYTIRKHFGGIEGLKVALVGDLKYGRTVHSLAQGLNQFRVSLTLVSPPGLRMPEDVKRTLKNPWREREALDVAGADVVYVTRIQKERFSDAMEYESVRGVYRVTPEALDGMNPKGIVLHPLPRVDEITVDVDALPQAKYFEQARNGVFVRMAVLDLVVNG